MLGQSLVDERVVRIEELEHAPILADDVLEKEFSLANHGRTQGRVERLVGAGVRRQGSYRAEHEPLTGEVLNQGIRLRVLQHPPDLRLERAGLTQLPLPGEREQLVVRHTRPE